MKRHVIYDKTNGNIDSIVSWGDNRELPSDYSLDSNQVVKTIEDDSLDINGFEYCYNSATDTFLRKLTVVSDKVQINSFDGIANISINYPEAVNEVCKLTVDGQTLDVDIINGAASFLFSSQILGWHNIAIESSTHCGKESINVEVI